jgi:hypothetical protein
MSFSKFGGMIARPAPLAFAGSVAILAGAGSARGALSATAEMSTAQTTAPYTYTITLHNTGTTQIGTFWFAWTLQPREYDFLPSISTSVVAPSGWIAPISHNATPGDLYGIEYYNISGSNIAPGGSALFQFTSNDSPATLAGPAWFSGFNVTHSVVYIGFPETDPGFNFDVHVVPAPGAAAIGCIAAVSLVRRRRR